MLNKPISKLWLTPRTSDIGAKNKVYILLLFVTSPILSLIVSIKNYKASWAKDIVWLFVAFYGFTMVISHEGMDANHYRNNLVEMANTSLTLNNFTYLLFSGETNYVDIVQPFMTFVVSRFTSDHRFLFLLFGLTFGYFYSRNIWFLIDKLKPEIRGIYIPFLITFAFIIGFWQINGFRMWTAAHIFFFGAVKYIYEGKKKGLLIASFSILVHFSFVLPVILILVHMLIKQRVHLLFWFYIASFFIAELDLSAVNTLLKSIVPDAFVNRVDGYTNEEYASTLNESVQQNNWYAIFYIKALNWVIIAFISIMYFKGLKFIKSQQHLLNLYTYSLLFLGLANVLSSIPSVGRFVLVADLFAITSIVIFLHYAPKIVFIKRLLPFAIPALLLYCIVALRIGFDTIGVVTIMGNPLVAMLTNVEVALIELIK